MMENGDKAQLMVGASKYNTNGNHLVFLSSVPTCTLYRRIEKYDEPGKHSWIVLWDHLPKAIHPYFDTPLYGGYVVAEADLAVI